ncbi:MAG: dethiobiotin synthase [Magnetococcales bacterium]|nr:dethiobiotin synthase [Magnetococcales bacterium]
MNAPNGLFLTGTDTDVGKTVAAAWLLPRMKGNYFKPVQAGLSGETDSQVVQRLSGLSSDRFFPGIYDLQRPMSPHESARLEGVEIDMTRFVLPESDRPLLVEGAGGLMVPLNRDALIIDLMVQLALPVVLVSRTALGTINHTLLSLEALRARGLEVLGVILNGPIHEANRRAIATYGHVRILAEIPHLEPLTHESLRSIDHLDFPLLESMGK